MYDQIRKIEFEITESCNALCPMCVRTRNAYPNELQQESWLRNSQIDLDQFQAIARGIEFRQLQSLDFCGNFGDPLANVYLLRILRCSLAANPSLSIRISTNGSLRPATWWRELGELSRVFDITVIFGLDGVTQESHSLYRVNTSFDRILANATSFITNGGRAEWQMLVFQHNEGEIDTARSLAKVLGFKRFYCLRTDRFDGLADLHYVWRGTPHKLTAIAQAPITDTRAPEAQDSNCTLMCEALRDQSVFIDCDGYVLPCCYLGILSHLYLRDMYPLQDHTDLREIFEGMDFSELDATRQPLSKVIRNPFFTDLKAFWQRLKPKRCFDACGTDDAGGSPVLGDDHWA
jgi:MoaA/NifB/PqqE/SkfB family radical SAM enzyme